MSVDFARRATSALLSAGIVLVAWSACGGGALTMSAMAMVCCAEHHGDCEMVRMGASCCDSDQAHIGMLDPARVDGASSPCTPASIDATTPVLLTPGLLTGPGAEPPHRLRTPHIGSHLTCTVLLI